MDTDERARLEALRELGLLDTEPEERFDRVVRLAHSLFDVPVVAVNLIDDDRVFVKSAIGTPTGESIPRAAAFCPDMVAHGEALVIPDAAGDPRWADNRYVRGAPHLRFYAGAPLSAPGEIQRRLLPREAPYLPGYDIAGRCQPALHVGGDYYDWYFLDDTMLQVTVADVMGKGLAAGVITAGLRTALRVSSRFNPLTESVRRTAEGLADDFYDSGTFATMFTARLRPQHGHLEYVDAGHGLAVVVTAHGRVRHLRSRDLPLGADPDGTWNSHESRLDPGDTLIVVSDGLLDAFPEPTDALRAAVELSASASSAGEMADRILAAGAAAPLGDDLTAVVVRRSAA